MFMEERHKEIIAFVNQNGRILVSEIQSMYAVSADCARRDLRFLENKGVLQRTHGGAISIRPSGMYPEKMYNPKELEEIKVDYLSVARKGIELIQNHEVIYLTTSAVGYYMAMNLPAELEVTVLTNSISIAEVLRKKENVSVVLLGGLMSHRGNCHDYYTVQMVKNIRIDKAFLSHDALSLEFGATIHSSEGMDFIKTVMKNSTMNIGLYPSEKVGRNSIHSVCKMEEYDLIITDSNISRDFVKQLEEMGISYEIAKIDEGK